VTDYKLLYEAEQAISAMWHRRYDTARMELAEDGQLQDKIGKLEKELETADRTIWAQTEKLEKLTAENERLQKENLDITRLNAVAARSAHKAESELTTLRERVARAEAELVKSINPAARAALEALRGR
jgi:archaellum component FlaC